jgi:hypothetical protein
VRYRFVINLRSTDQQVRSRPAYPEVYLDESASFRGVV